MNRKENIEKFLHVFNIPQHEACNGSWVIVAYTSDDPYKAEIVSDILDDDYKVIQYIKHRDKLYSCPF